MEHRCLSPWKGAVAGGAIVFAWSRLSAAVLPFHAPLQDAAVVGLPACVIAAFFWTWILGKIPGLTLKDAALYGAFFGICVGVLGPTTNLARWKLSVEAAYLADAVIAWTLASLALSRCYAAACPLPGKPTSA